MTHLGRWLSAQVDGELDGVERDRVLNHLAGCDDCREEAVALRVLKRRMVALGDAGADSAIAGRLIERARSGQDLIALTAGELDWPPDSRSMGLTARQPWLSWRVATGSASTAIAAIGVLAFMLGGAPAGRPVPKVSPAVDAYWMQHNNDTGQRWISGARAHKSSSPAAFMPGMAAHGLAAPGGAGPGSVTPGGTVPGRVPAGSTRSASVPGTVPAALRLDSP